MVCPTRADKTKVGADLGRAFASLGHEVGYFDYDRRPLSLSLVPKPLRLASGYAEKLLAAQNRGLASAVRRTRPGFVFVVKGFEIAEATRAAIAESGARLAGYWIDDPLDHERGLRLAQACDVFFTNDRTSVERYRGEGVRRIVHLPSAASSALFRPLGVPRDLRIAFLGTRSERRAALLGELRDFPIDVFGPGWNKAGLGGKIRVHPAAFGEAANRIYNRALINLNVHNWVGAGSAVNLRLFEVPAAGAFLLSDWVDEIADCYVEGEHLACYRGGADLKAKLEHFLSRPEECERIARAGRAHFLAHHTYEARARRVLAELA